MTEEQKERIRIWIKDLRDHPELQGKGMLRTSDNKFCCLGRACEVYRLETGEGEWSEIVENVDEYEENKLGFIFYTRSDKEGKTLPRSVMYWFGFDEEDPKVGTSKYLSEYNDDVGMSFSEIANIIERYIDGTQLIEGENELIFVIMNKQINY